MEVDDRLASVLDALSDDEQWQAFERELSRHLIRVYDLRPSRVRVDSSTISGYVQPTPDGLFQFGHEPRSPTRPAAGEDQAVGP